MTTKASACSQPLVPEHDVASSMEGMPLKAGFSSRGYSDSDLPSCRASGGKKYHLCDFVAPVLNDLAADVIQNTDMQSPAIPVKHRQHLQLPSFKSLGISSRVPDALLTPPDEATIHDCLSSPAQTSFPSVSRRFSYPAIAMPKTPSPDQSDSTSVLGSVATTSEASTTGSNPPTLAASELQVGNAELGTDPMGSDSENSDVVPSRFEWLKEATDVLGECLEVIAIAWYTLY